MGSQMITSQSKTDGLPVIDFSKSYPEKEVRLQDIADVEYVPLETTDDLLLSGEATLSCISDKYIIVYESRFGDIYVFNRNGKIHSRFNRRGGSGQEYLWIKSGVIFDEKTEEIYVCAQSIQVYSMNGEYKRTLKINTIEREMKIFNFDDEALLVYEESIKNPYVKGASYSKEKPYRLVFKKDGSLISDLDIRLPERYSNRQFIGLDNNRHTSAILFYPRNMHYGQDFVIADMSSDTLYLLNQNRQITPLLTRKPSVHESAEKRTIWTTFFTTDKFIIIGMLPLEINWNGGKGGGGTFPVFMYEFETGRTSDISFLFAEAGRRGKWYPATSLDIAKNSTAELVQPQEIRERYRLTRLKGNFETLAQGLSDDDNPVVRIVKFK
jgi:hypothetical protein